LRSDLLLPRPLRSPNFPVTPLMKNNGYFFLFAAGLAPAFSIQGQTLLFDFSSSANFGSSASRLGNGVYVISSGVANHTVPTASSNDGAYLAHTGAVGSQ